MTTVVACTFGAALWDIWSQRLIQFSLRFWFLFRRCPDEALNAFLLFIRQSCLILCEPWTTAPRLPCPSLSPRVCSDSCPLSCWCHPTFLSSVVPFSSCLQSFPAPGSFPVSQLFTSGGQSVGSSASASVLPMNIQDWFPLRLTGLNSLLSQGLSRVFSNSTVQKNQFFGTQLSL